MRLQILHHTRYIYSAAVDLAQHMVHLSPVDTPMQRVISHRLDIDPLPTHLDRSNDAFGNCRCFFSLQSAHDALSVRAHSLVDTTAPPAIRTEDSPAWERVRERYRYRAAAPYDPAVAFTFASPQVPRDEAFQAFARPAFAPGTPWLEAVRLLMERIHRELRYESASTAVNTPALDALAQGKGVCQDFAHIMLGCLRSMGLPARYVSGYLLTQPPPGRPRLLGADASHAWVSVHLPPDAEAQTQGSWIDFDPTNNRWGLESPGEDYVRLAVGRDFSDLSPMRGVIQGGGDHVLEVGVTVAPPAQFPVPA